MPRIPDGILPFDGHLNRPYEGTIYVSFIGKPFVNEARFYMPEVMEAEPASFTRSDETLLKKNEFGIVPLKVCSFSRLIPDCSECEIYKLECASNWGLNFTTENCAYDEDDDTYSMTIPNDYSDFFWDELHIYDDPISIKFKVIEFECVECKETYNILNRHTIYPCEHSGYDWFPLWMCKSCHSKYKGLARYYDYHDDSGM